LGRPHTNRSTLVSSSAASDVYKRQLLTGPYPPSVEKLILRDSLTETDILGLLMFRCDHSSFILPFRQTFFFLSFFHLHFCKQMVSFILYSKTAIDTYNTSICIYYIY